MTLARRTMSGLLWLSLGMTLSATPMVVPGLDLTEMNRSAQAALTAKLNDPQQGLDDLCFDPPYFLVLPDPTQPADEDQADYSGVLPSGGIDIDHLTLGPSSLALTGMSLVVAGLFRRRSRT